jgi:hypothetical protein
MPLSGKTGYYNSISLHDLLFNTLLVFFILFTIAFLKMLQKQMDANIKAKAEFIIMHTWGGDRLDDVDTWLQDPTGEIVWFRQKETGLMHLDRDDLGIWNDTITLPDGRKIECKENQEIVTIRGIIAGEWTLNVHLYSRHKDPGPMPVSKVQVTMLNPVAQLIFSKEITFKKEWEEVTVCRFVMSNKGNIIALNELPKSLVSERLEVPGR